MPTALPGRADAARRLNHDDVVRFRLAGDYVVLSAPMIEELLGSMVALDGDSTCLYVRLSQCYARMASCAALGFYYVDGYFCRQGSDYDYRRGQFDNKLI